MALVQIRDGRSRIRASVKIVTFLTQSEEKAIVQQVHYNKIGLVMLGLVAFCTIIASLVLIFFLVPMMSFGGGPFGMGAPPNIPDDVLQDLKDEIYSMESVITFKEVFPDYRENLEEDYGVDYVIQSRNENTGNILSLHVRYHPMGPPGSTDRFQSTSSLECLPGEGIVGPRDMMMDSMFRNVDDLFMHEKIKSTDCLDDDWEPVMVAEKP